MSYARVTARNALVFKRAWRGTILFTFFTPILFLSAMGLGMGVLVSRGPSDALGGVSYLQFFASAMMAAAPMNASSFEATFPILGKMVWHRNYEAMLATPLRVPQLFFGELAWIAIRMGMVTISLFIVLTLFGVPQLATAWLSIPVGILVGLAFSALIMSFTATRESSEGFNALFRFFITPMFLFSGTFFPLDTFPPVVRTLANISPLYHGIELVRGLTLTGISAPKAAGHLLVLFVLLGIGIWLGLRNFTRRLVS